MTWISTSHPGLLRPATCTTARVGRLGWAPPKYCVYASMKPLVSARPPLAGSPTRKTCISTTSPIVRPRPVSTSLIFFSTLSDCVLVSPKDASESAGAALSTTDGTWPLMKCSVAMAGTETASAIGKSEPGILWRTMSSALALAASSDSAAGINNWTPRRMIFFFMVLSICVGGSVFVGDDAVAERFHAQLRAQRHDVGLGQW